MELTLENKRHPRKAYGKTLVELGEENPRMVVLDADLSCSTQTYMFGEVYPDRFFNVGVAEQNLMSMAAGFAVEDRMVFASTFAMFGAGRGWEQIRNSISYDSLNVKVVLTHAGITVGKDGASHQIIEDISLMRVIPGMRVYVPSDYSETAAVIRHIADFDGPAYVRLCREKMPDIYPDDYEFDFDKPTTLIEGDDVAIITCGFMTASSILAARELSKQGVSARVVDVHSIKPLDKDVIVDIARGTGAVMTVEEHNIYGGLGSAVAEVLSENHPTIMKRVGINDKFGVSGSTPELLEAYNLTTKDIVSSANELIKKKL